jgi:hypothetical protein
VTITDDDNIAIGSKCKINFNSIKWSTKQIFTPIFQLKCSNFKYYKIK